MTQGTQFWLVSVPGESTGQEGKDRVWGAVQRRLTEQADLSVNYKFKVPTSLKVGTLDALVSLSDQLTKLTQTAEGVARRVAHSLVDLLEDHKDKIEESLRANDMDPDKYVTRFQWDAAKYPVLLSVPELAGLVSKQVTNVDTDLKAKMSAYQTVRSSIAALDRRANGNLMVRGLEDLVKREDFVLGSENMETLLVVVPRNAYKEWLGCYEKLTQMVVPRSSAKLHEDNEHGLFTVTLFRRVVDEFKHKARERRFVVREFEYSEKAFAEGKMERNKLESDRKRKWSDLVRWCKVNFSEAFTAWIHALALRAFVESVLRYGLPVNFQAIMVQPHRKQERKARAALNDLFQHLDRGGAVSKGDASDKDMPAHLMGTVGGGEYFPYVSLNVDTRMTEKQF